MLKKLLLMTFFCGFAMLAQANAQTAILPEKQAAIKEMMALIDADNQVEQVIEIFSSQMGETQNEILKGILRERTDLTAADKKQIEEMLLVNDQNARKIYQERLMKKISYRELLDEIMVGLYDKFYTLEEINDLLVFYKSPTGQKLIKSMPEVAAETIKGVQEKLVPKVLTAMKEIEDEDRRAIEQKVEAKKPRTKKPAAK